MSRLVKNHRGVTLIELVVSTAIISLFIVLVMTFLVNKYVENTRANAQADLLLQTQLSLDLINRDLRHAANVDSQNRWADDNSPGSPADDYTWDSDGNSLVLAEPAVDDDNEILYEDSNAYVSYKDNFVYFLQDGTLYRRTIVAEVEGNTNSTTCPVAQSGCAADSKLAENVTNLSFSYYDADDQPVSPGNARSVGVSLTVSRLLYGRQVEVAESIRTVMRND